MKLLLATTALMVCAIGTAQAEIACTKISGCWETGRTIRLPNNPSQGVDTKVTDRRNSHMHHDASKYKTLDDIPNQHCRHHCPPVFNQSDEEQGD
jgi:hypothetical protein